MDWRRFFNPKTPPQTSTQKSPSAIPMLDQVMTATKGATDAFSGVSNQLNTSFKMLGNSSVQGIVGYGIGLRHGIGIGLSMRSGVTQLQSRLVEPMSKMAGLIPGLPFGRGALPMPSKIPSDQISAESMMQLATKSAASQISQGLVGSQPTNVDLAFNNKALKKDGVGLDEAAGLMQPENKLLQTVMKQRQIIDELVEENEKLCQILQVKDLKIPSSNLQPSSSDLNIQTFPSSEEQKKIISVSRSSVDADDILKTSKAENDGTLSISKGENDGTLPISKGKNDGKKE